MIVAYTTWRDAPPRLTNTDGDPLLIITSTINVADGELRRPLKTHPDFETAEDHFTWWGREMTATEKAQAVAKLKQQGYEPEEEEPGTQRWVRGKVEEGMLRNFECETARSQAAGARHMQASGRVFGRRFSPADAAEGSVRISRLLLATDCEPS